MRLFEYINTLGVAVPTSHHWPLGDEGKQAKKPGGVRSAPLPLGFKTSHFGLDGDPKRGCGGKNQLPNGGFAGAAASLLVLRVHVVTCLTSKADSGFTSKHAVIDVN